MQLAWQGQPKFWPLGPVGCLEIVSRIGRGGVVFQRMDFVLLFHGEFRLLWSPATGFRPVWIVRWTRHIVGAGI